MWSWSNQIVQLEDKNEQELHKLLSYDQPMSFTCQSFHDYMSESQLARYFQYSKLPHKQSNNTFNMNPDICNASCLLHVHWFELRFTLRESWYNQFSVSQSNTQGWWILDRPSPCLCTHFMKKEKIRTPFAGRLLPSLQYGFTSYLLCSQCNVKTKMSANYFFNIDTETGVSF